MKKAILLGIFCAAVTISFAQKETFDLSTYTPPKGWKKVPAEGGIQFTKEDAAKGTYCMITLYKAVPGKADSKENFDLAWESLVKEMITVSAPPEMQAPDTKNGWEVQSGYAPFEKEDNKGIVVLVTATGVEKMVNVLILTNTDAYEKNVSDFLTSVSLKKEETALQQTPTNKSNNSPVTGTWGVSTTTASFYNTSINEGSIVTQYTFNANGTYSFYVKTFRYQLDKLLLTRETGTYQISGTNITIAPQKSVVEAWSRKDGTDNWGKLLSSQKRELEKTTYQFITNDFGSGPVLILKAGKVTKRDGYFNNSDKDAWFYPSKTSIEFIKLPGGEQIATKEIQKETVKETATNRSMIAGTWAKQGSVHETYGDPVSHGNAGYSKDQYTFNENGTYSFIAKTFRSSFEKILLVKESGTYQISGNTLTISPQKSVIEAWSKKDGTDKWGKLLTSQKRTLEKVTYQFTQHYFSGIQETNLVLQAGIVTQRDGPFGNNTTFSKAWYYRPITPNNTLIELPGSR